MNLTNGDENRNITPLRRRTGKKNKKCLTAFLLTPTLAVWSAPPRDGAATRRNHAFRIYAGKSTMTLILIDAVNFCKMVWHRRSTQVTPDSTTLRIVHCLGTSRLATYLLAGHSCVTCGPTCKLEISSRVPPISAKRTRPTMPIESRNTTSLDLRSRNSRIHDFICSFHDCVFLHKSFSNSAYFTSNVMLICSKF